MIRNISREELKEKMDRGEEFSLVDTLEEPYYRHSHLPGAINIPLEEIERAPEVLPDKAAEIVVYCMDPPCELSEKAARKLEAMGYENVATTMGAKRTGWRLDFRQKAAGPKEKDLERWRQRALEKKTKGCVR